MMTSRGEGIAPPADIAERGESPYIYGLHDREGTAR